MIQKNGNDDQRGSVSLWHAIILLFILFVFIEQVSQADESSGMGAGMGKSAQPAGAGARLSVYDGDTFTIDGERIRIAAIDTPERASPHCDAERRLARLARARLVQLLGDGSGVTLEREALPDRYGRTLARVMVNGRDVAPVLINEGLAATWEGRRHNWCCT